jgi:anti-anti-sigma regulatory factor
MGFDDKGPRLGGVAPFTGKDPYAYARSQPFADMRTEGEPRETYKMPKRTRSRLLEIVNRLADVAGGAADLELEVSSDDEIGWLEQILNEMVLNLRFSKEALAEQNEQLELRVAERTAALEDEVEERRLAEELVARQADEILLLSTPIMSIAKGVLVAPLIGVPDDRRAQQLADRLLQSVVSANAEVVLLDITGVPILDTHTAQHLIRTLSAVRLLGCRAVVTGVRPSIARTLVHLGVDLSRFSTRSSLMAGLELALTWQEAER